MNITYIQIQTVNASRHYKLLCFHLVWLLIVTEIYGTLSSEVIFHLNQLMPSFYTVSIEQWQALKMVTGGRSPNH